MITRYYDNQYVRLIRFRKTVIKPIRHHSRRHWNVKPIEVSITTCPQLIYYYYYYFFFLLKTIIFSIKTCLFLCKFVLSWHYFACADGSNVTIYVRHIAQYYITPRIPPHSKHTHLQVVTELYCMVDNEIREECISMYTSIVFCVNNIAAKSNNNNNIMR
jgi:hypothetical protein